MPAHQQPKIPDSSPAKGADALQVLHALYAARTREGFVELRPIRPHGGALKQEFSPSTALPEVAVRAVELRAAANVYFGVALRSQRTGGKDAVLEVPALWADVDSEQALERLGAFPLQPSFTISSGSAENIHAYWVFDKPVSVEEGEGLNRALAARLASDRQAVDAGRVLRLPGTLNHKAQPPLEVRLGEYRDVRYSLGELREALGAHQAATEEEGDGAASAVQRVLARLAGVLPTGNGWAARCPAHNDTRPSLSVSEGEDGRCLVNCFGGCDFEKIAAALGLPQSDFFAKEGASTKLGMAAQLVQLADQATVELFHDEAKQPLASIPVDGHREICPGHSTTMKRWLRQQLYGATGQVVAAQALNDACESLAARAQFEGARKHVAVRVGATEEAVYIDLGDDEWRAIEVRADGWQIREQSPIPFLRRNSTLALPVPERGGTLDELRKFLNLPDERSWRLVISFLVMALQPQGSFPILVLQGEQGSAKTTAARVLRLLVDPVKAMLRAGSPSVRDLMIAATGQWLIGFDNVSRVDDRLSDALCQLSTGAGYAQRQLYTDSEEVVFEAMRPAILNGIAGIAQRPDFLSRAIVIVLPEISEDDRKAEKAFWRDFEDARPQILGALLDLLAQVLAVRADLEPERAPRLADFALVGPRWRRPSTGRTVPSLRPWRTTRTARSKSPSTRSQ